MCYLDLQTELTPNSKNQDESVAKPVLELSQGFRSIVNKGIMSENVFFAITITVKVC